MLGTAGHYGMEEGQRCEIMVFLAKEERCIPKMTSGTLESRVQAGVESNKIPCMR